MRKPRRCTDCLAPVRWSPKGKTWFHTGVPEWLATIARNTEIIKKVPQVP